MTRVCVSRVTGRGDVRLFKNCVQYAWRRASEALVLRPKRSGFVLRGSRCALAPQDDAQTKQMKNEARRLVSFVTHDACRERQPLRRFKTFATSTLAPVRRAGIITRRHCGVLGTLTTFIPTAAFAGAAGHAFSLADSQLAHRVAQHDVLLNVYLYFATAFDHSRFSKVGRGCCQRLNAARQF